ncbi:hypothetical protein GPECTOR_67g318 [Gonium pectorale]|uniref:SAP domain-containing protein n=1 Tax=Gonium pectorale TaxID=33097 RepID=A0A150G3S2_GONPE|nr:hypothetical protein GPECTOR_67g318 [Gonium pectorale]|eukprot:KXZ44478.1 hypothetical protein GPECTOR_67g318 [Gonium pectorale]
MMASSLPGTQQGSTADVDEGEDGDDDLGPPPPPGDLMNGQYWMKYVDRMSFKDMQYELKQRGMPAAGKRSELQVRLAALLSNEHQTRSDRGAAVGAGQQLQPKAGTRRAEPEAADEQEAGLEGQELVEAVLDALEEVPYAELKQRAAARGMSSLGKKADLQRRLADAIIAEGGEELQQLLGQEAEEEFEEEEEEFEEADVVEARAAASASAAVGAGSEVGLLDQLLGLTKAELEASLREYDAPVSGTKRQLAERLAGLMAAEAEAEAAEEAEEAGEEDEYEEDEQEYEEAEEEAPARAGSPPPRPFDPASLTPADRRLLLDAESRRLRKEYADKTRQQLYKMLRERRVNPSYSARDVLMDTLVRLEADKALEAEIEAAAADPDAGARLTSRLAALRAAPPASAGAEEGGEEDDAAAGGGAQGVDYTRLTMTDVRRMRVEELRMALQHFGMDSSGNKYVMIERLLTHLESVNGITQRKAGRPMLDRSAASAAAPGSAEPSAAPASSLAASGAAAAERVLGMSLRTLREELDSRGLPTAGSRGELQTRLIAAMRQEVQEARRLSAELQGGAGAEAGGAEGEPEGEPDVGEYLASLSAVSLEQRAAAAVAAISSDPTSLLVMGGEAPVDVAVVAGCPPGRLDLAEQSLAAARALLDQLYTAPLDTPHTRMCTPRLLPEGAEEALAQAMAEAEAAEAAEAAQAESEADVDAMPAEAEVLDEGEAAGEGEQGEGAVVAGRAGIASGVANVGSEDLDDWQREAVSAAPRPGAVARPASGVVVGVWWLDGVTGACTLLSPAQVYTATAAELAAGCLPAVHTGLLAVPPPSPLSLSTPKLEGPVPPAEEQEAGAVSFPDLESLAAHLRGSAHVVFPALPAGSGMYCGLAEALAKAGVAAVGSGPEEAAAAVDRVSVLNRLTDLSYPVVPLLELSPADVAGAVREAALAVGAEAEAQANQSEAQAEQLEAQTEEEAAQAAVARLIEAAEGALRAKLEAWCKEQGLHPERQLFFLRLRNGGPEAGFETALGAARAAELSAGSLAQYAAQEEVDDAGPRLVVEPAPPAGAVRFVCSVVETPDGPVALLPAEVELYDTEMAITAHTADLMEWEALKRGIDPQDIADMRSNVLAVEMEPWRAAYDPRVTPTLPPTSVARLHTPPRMSRKLTHAVRHAAARLFGQLGLRDCATVEGWVELPAGYAEAMEAAGRDEDGDMFPTLYDPDPLILDRLAEQEAERLAAEAAPLEEYYDAGRSWHADLDMFDPSVRLSGASNGEGATVRITAVTPDLPLTPRHPAVLTAAELGLTHGSLLRNLANSALRRAAAAGDERALTPSEPYVSPPDALEAAALAAELDEALAAADAEEAEEAEEEPGEGEAEAEEEPISEEAMVAEAEAQGLMLVEDEDGELVYAVPAEPDLTDPVAAAVAAAEEPIEVPPAPLQLPMPPLLPQYHTAVMQHLREADEYDQWVETHDPDHWDDADGPVRVTVMAEALEREMELESGMPRGVGDCPEPLAEDMLSAVAVEGQREALNAAVQALGDFGAALSAAMSSMPLNEAVDADAEIPLYRCKPLPDPDEVLGGGVDGTAADPRVQAAWQVAAIAELARRHGWEVVEAVDAEEEQAELEALRQQAGVAAPTREEEEAAAREAAEEQSLLEAMCENDDEVMELRTGMITPVQLYLRFRARQARRPPTSHPITNVVAIDSEDEAEDGEEEEGEADEDEAEAAASSIAIARQEGKRSAVALAKEAAGKTAAPAEAEEGDEEEAEGEAEEPPVPEAEAREAFEAGFGAASTGPGYGHPAAYKFHVPPDDAVELDVPNSAGLMVAGALAAELAAGRDGGLAGAVGRAALSEPLTATELEALATMELGYKPVVAELDEESGEPVIGALGPAPNGLTEELVVGGWGGTLAELPSFRPLAAVMDDAGVTPEGAAEDADGEEAPGALAQAAMAPTAAQEVEAEWDWSEEDAFERGVARAVEAEDAGRAAAAAAGYDDEEDEDEDANASLAEEALAAGDLDAAELAAVAPPLAPTRVWIVVGGDGHWGREAGLAAGLNVLNKLHKYQDLVVEPFLMVPMGEGRNDEARRRELLSRRTEYLAGVGMDEDDLPDAMGLGALRSGQPVITGRPETEPIYAVPLPTLLRPSVPEALFSLERTASREGVALHALSAMQRQQRVAHLDTQAELAAAGLEGVAGLWDGNVTGQSGPPPARPLDLDSFAEAAQQAGAVVVVAARGEMAECGALQTLLELNGVPFLGSGSEQLSLLWDKGLSEDLLQDLSDVGIDPPPRFMLPTDDFLTAAELSPEDAEELLDRMRHEVLEEDAAEASPPPPLLIRPVADTAGVGVARLGCGADVVAYAAALQAGAAVLPPDTLSYPHVAIPLPPRPPALLAFEPFVESDPLVLVVSAEGEAEGEESKDGQAEAGATGASSELVCLRGTGWLEVSFALIGSPGTMTCLPPAMWAAVVSAEDLAEADAADTAVAEAVAEASDAATVLAEGAEAMAETAEELGLAAQSAVDAGDADAEAKVTAANEMAEKAQAAAAEAEEAGQRLSEMAPPLAAAQLIVHSPRSLVVPPPPDVIPAAALQAACKRCEAVADRLGLRGLVQVEAFVAVDSGDLVVYDINAAPDLGPDSPIYRQAAAAGLLPSELLRELIGLALQARAEPDAEAATFEAQMDDVQYDGNDEYDQYAPGRLGLGGEDEEEGEAGDLGAGEEGEEADDDMLGQLEEMRDAVAADEEGYEEEGFSEEGAGGRLAGMGADAGYGAEAGGEGYFDFDDEEGGGGGGAGAGGRATGGVGGGYMGLNEFGRNGQSGGRGGRGRDGFDDDDY